jgi:hypothetical protein
MSTSVPPGYRVGDWTVRDLLAEGSFGTVYTADRATARSGLPARAALKFLSTGTTTPRQLRHLQDLAEREVELLRAVRHSRLIRMYETLSIDDPGHPALDGATVLVLELAEQSLADVLDRDGGPADTALLVQICEGLAQVHRAGWVHGDLKPANVLLMADGTVRLTDFNLAAELEGSHAYSPAFATPDYSPPELLWSEFSERGQRIRPTADVWAFGVLAHIALTGTYPMPGGTPSARQEASARYARGAEELRLHAGLPPAWRDIITDCLARDHRERAAHSPDSLLPRVRAAGRPGTGPRRWWPRRPRRLSRRGRLALGTAALATAALGAGVPLLLASEEQEPDPAVQEPDPAAQEPDPAGYDRCAEGNICFFTGPDGQGDMCDWFGNDEDWRTGDISCNWPDTAPVRSIFNNGMGADMGETFVDVVYFSGSGFTDRLGCVPVQTRTTIAEPAVVKSHEWAETCDVP